jgi:hypothetical protein
MDIIPWHSPNFRGLFKARFSLPNTIDEFKSKVIIPAALIAKKSLITRYVNSLPGKTNKIVLVAVGALYSNNLYLNQIGFNNITNTIPAHIGHVILNQRIITGNNSKITIWHISGNHLKGKLNDDISDLSSRDVYIINMWTPNIGMNIPSAIQITFNHILQNL